VNDSAAREVLFWRREAAAVLCRDMALRVAALAAGDDARAVNILVSSIMPMRSALCQALAGETAPASCDLCGGPIEVGHQVIMFDDIGEAHFNCADPLVGGVASGEGDDGKPVFQPSHAFDDMFSPDRIAAVLREAKALSDCDSVTDAAPAVETAQTGSIGDEGTGAPQSAIAQVPLSGEPS
jgi:hypothetical protein